MKEYLREMIFRETASSLIITAVLNLHKGELDLAVSGRGKYF